MTASWWYWERDTLILYVHVQPRASCNEIVGMHGERLKVRVVCSPTGGEANKCLIAILAKEFRVPRSAIALQSGERTRDKRLAVHAPRAFPAWFPAYQEASIRLSGMQGDRARAGKPDHPRSPTGGGVCGVASKK